VFLTNYWYAAAWASEITSAPLARTILDRPIALFRTESGALGAFDDCCPHRMAPLSFGSVVGETLRCGYHGLRFDCGGKCVEIPGQASIPPRAKVRAYPTVERWKLAWIWMGQPAAADPAAIPALTWLDDPEWDFSHGTVVYDCNHVLMCDNLMDLSHTTFTHRRTIGTDDVARTGVTTKATADTVLVERMMRNTEPSPFYKTIGGFTERVDRWQKIEYTPPTSIVIDAGAVPAGTNDRSRGIDTRIINMITPETPTRTFQFWAFARNFRVGDDALTRWIADAIVLTFNEDKTIIDAQQRNVTARPNQRMLDNNADAGVVLMRQAMDRCLARERAGAGAAE
jgi:vanillate O-demethylase monooxygenase subunit